MRALFAKGLSRGFLRVQLKPDESRQVAIPIRLSDFATFDVGRHVWVLEKGKYEVRVGTSSRDLPLHAALTVPDPREFAP